MVEKTFGGSYLVDLFGCMTEHYLKENMGKFTLPASNVDGLDEKVKEHCSIYFSQMVANIDTVSVAGLDRVIKTEVEKAIDDFGNEVEKTIENITVDADDVSGLPEMIESVLKDHTVDADDVSGLSDHIASFLDDYDFELDVDSISGLERTIENEVEKAIDNLEADSISGLDDEIDKRLEEALKEIPSANIIDLNEEISKVVKESGFIEKKVQEAFESPNIQYLLTKKVQESLQQIIANMVGGLLKS